MSKKDIILKIFEECKNQNCYVFDNEKVKDIVKKLNSKTNPYDMTKIDQLEKLPQFLQENNWSIVHIGNGKHEFIQGIQNYIYHTFEEINENEVINWQYQASILNQFSTSESAILSVCFNQKIIHDFLYKNQDFSKAKMYNSERKKGVNFEYTINNINKKVENLQIEIDLTTELNGVVSVFEGKNISNTNINDFNVFQIYNPFRYYYNLQQDNKLPIKEINCCYLVQNKQNGISKINIYLYTFTNPLDISSISLIKKNQYVLQKR